MRGDAGRRGGVGGEGCRDGWGHSDVNSKSAHAKTIGVCNMFDDFASVGRPGAGGSSGGSSSSCNSGSKSRSRGRGRSRSREVGGGVGIRGARKGVGVEVGGRGCKIRC